MSLKTSPGCCGCGLGTFSVTARGCNALVLPGAIVQVKSGTTVVASGTTDVNGVVTLQVGAGTYTIEVSKARFVLSSGSHSVTAGGTTTVSRNLTVATGYHCLGICVDPVPDNLTLTDSNGAHPFNYNAGKTGWYLCYSKTVTTQGGPGCFSSGTITTPFSVTMQSSGGLQWIYLCCGSGESFQGDPVDRTQFGGVQVDCTNESTYGARACFVTKTLAGTCVPTNLTATAVSVPAVGAPDAGILVSGTITITE